MNQSGIIFGALLVGFVVYITTKGRLPAYGAVLFGTVKPNDAAPAGDDKSSSSSSSSNSVSDVTPLGFVSKFFGAATTSGGSSDGTNPTGFGSGLFGGTQLSGLIGGGSGSSGLNIGTALQGYESYLALAAFI